jgi:hypothetical protein
VRRPVVEETDDAVALLGGDQRSQRGVRVTGVAHDDLPQVADQLCGEGFGDVGVHDEAGRRHTFLTGVVQPCRDHFGSGVGQVRVVEHDHRSVTAEFEDRAVGACCRGRRDPTAGRC